VSLVVDVSGGVPDIVHWGAPLAAPDAARLAALTTRPITHGSLDAVPPLQVLPQHSLGTLARPGLLGHRPGGRDWAPRFGACELRATDRSVVTVSHDYAAKLRLEVRLELDDSGALCARATVTNEGDSRYLLDALTITLPVPSHARDLTTYSGRWSRESSTHRQTIDHGAWSAENRTGRTSHEYPPTLWWSTTDAREWSGEAWGVHLAWSGNHALYAEVMPDGRRYAQLGELLMPGEVCLQAGESYTTPTVVGAYSGGGFTPASWVMHEHVRAAARATAASPRTRKVLINTWEATYYHHDTAQLLSLADAAADLGIERFVLDDGWFGARRNDRAGLGDWVVSREVYPNGLTPLIDHVRSRGMDFGIWIEPEMVNRDSDVLRAHPEWVLHPPDYEPVMARHQLLLDLTNQAAFAHVHAQLDALLRDHEIAFVKWDMNRPLIHASTTDGAADGAANGAAGARRQTLAFYRLLDALRAAHPTVEFESCASGGGRIDHAVLARTVRAWTSDCNDPLERQHIQRGTGMWVPNEMLGMHVAARTSHTTGRSQSIEMRALTALFGWMGVECDPRKLDDRERDVLRAAIALHKQYRELLHHGRTVRFDLDDDTALAHGTMANDRSEALLAYVQMQTSPWLVVPRWRIEGLDPDRTYTVTHLPLGRLGGIAHTLPGWMTSQTRCTGRELAVVGLQPPSLWPESGVLVHVGS
jgi:alpha-galactosidase